MKIILILLAAAHARDIRGYSRLERLAIRSMAPVHESSPSRETLAGRAAPGVAWSQLGPETQDRLAVLDQVTREVDRELDLLREKWRQAYPDGTTSRRQRAEIDRLEALVYLFGPQEIREILRGRLRQVAAATPTRESRVWPVRFPPVILEDGDVEGRVEVLADLLGWSIARALDAREAHDQNLLDHRTEDALRVIAELYLTLGANSGERRRLVELAKQTAVGELALSSGGVILLAPSLSKFALLGDGALGWAGTAVSVGAFAVAGVATFVNGWRELDDDAKPFLLPRVLRRREERRLARRLEDVFWRRVQNVLLRRETDSSLYDEAMRGLRDRPVDSSLIARRVVDMIVATSIGPVCHALLAD